MRDKGRVGKKKHDLTGWKREYKERDRGGRKSS